MFCDIKGLEYSGRYSLAQLLPDQFERAGAHVFAIVRSFPSQEAAKEWLRGHRYKNPASECPISRGKLNQNLWCKKEGNQEIYLVIAPEVELPE